MDIKTLIYSKHFNVELTHKLLHIADSPTIIEDLIDLIAEMEADSDDIKECIIPENCKHVEDVQEDKDDIEEDFLRFKSETHDCLSKLKDEITSLMDDCE